MKPLIAQALPRPKWVYNLARANRESCYYLQPALFQCEVPYEARLKENLGIGDENASENWSIRWSAEAQTDDKNLSADVNRCLNFNITLGEKCEGQIAIEKAVFKAGDWKAPLQNQAMDSDLTALNWACAKGADGVPAGLKAIRAASVHQPSYINGTGLILRHGGNLRNWDRFGPIKEPYAALTGEIPPFLFLSVAFGNVELCEALIEAGCNVNLLRSGEPNFYP